MEESVSEMMDVFFNGRAARTPAVHAEALRLLKGMHSRYHCEECICVVAKFLREQLPKEGKVSERATNRR